MEYVKCSTIVLPTSKNKLILRKPGILRKLKSAQFQDIEKREFFSTSIIDLAIGDFNHGERKLFSDARSDLTVVFNEKFITSLKYLRRCQWWESFHVFCSYLQTESSFLLSLSLSRYSHSLEHVLKLPGSHFYCDESVLCWRLIR